MNWQCLFGHHWGGCKCNTCGEARDEGHDWAKDCEKCSRCGKTRQDAHSWDGCTCKGCGKSRTTYDWLMDNQKHFEKLRAGYTISEKDKNECHRAHMAFYDELCRKHGTQTNYYFPEKDRVDFYISAMRMAIIDPGHHGGWPIISDIRRYVLDSLKKRIEEKEDPLLLYCAVFSAIVSDDFDYAVKSYTKLKKSDAFIADITTQYLEMGSRLLLSKVRCEQQNYHGGYGRLLDTIKAL